MITTVVKVGQSIIDIALQKYGDASGMFDIIVDNNIGLAENLTPGTILKIREKVKNKKVTDFFKINPKPATDVPIMNNIWILNSGCWNDNNKWVDACFWKDECHYWTLSEGSWEDIKNWNDKMLWVDMCKNWMLAHGRYDDGGCWIDNKNWIDN